MQVLVVRGDNVAAAAEIVDVPNAYHAEQDGHVLFEGGVDEVLIHQCAPSSIAMKFSSPR